MASLIRQELPASRLCQLFLGLSSLLLIFQLKCVCAQDIIALNSYQEGILHSFVDTDPPPLSPSTQLLTFDVTNLGEGREFYNRETLELQLGGDQPIKTFSKVLGNSETNQHFVGESDTGDSLQLINYVSPTTGRQLLVGSLVELDTKLVYQFRPIYTTEESLLDNYNEQILLAATVTPSEDIPESAEPFQVDSATQAKLESHRKEADQAYFADPLNKVSLATTDVLNTIKRQNNDSDMNIVTLMIVWSKRSECEYSNLTINCEVTAETEDNMRAAIAAAVAETNAAYQLSNIDVRHELVYAYRHPSYNELQMVEDDPLGIGVFGNTLLGVMLPWDGNMDDIPDMRREYQADMVSMVISNRLYCGIASIGTGFWPVPSASTMYSVVAYDCLAGTYVLAHELGHNFGCAHDRGTGDSCDFWRWYHAHGWRDPEAQFRTIMAYRCKSGQCDSSPGTSCPVIPRFSDSQASYNGLPLGDGRNDCSRHIRRYGRRVSRFYGESCLCFAPHMTVQVEGRRDVVEMKDLQEGDRVLALSRDGTFSFQTIYSINHYHRTRPTEFLQLHLLNLEGVDAEPWTLELSEYHMVFVQGRDNPIPAGRIQIGDLVQVLPPSVEEQWNDTVPDSSYNIVPQGIHAHVVDVKTVVRNGFYNPLTTDGTIVVNNVVASAYSSLLAVTSAATQEHSLITLDDEYIRVGQWKILSQHDCLHLMLGPYRALSLMRLLGLGLGLQSGVLTSKRANDLERQDYLSPYCSWGLRLGKWLQQQKDCIQVPVFLLLLLVCGLVGLYLYIWTLLALGCTLALLMGFTGRFRLSSGDRQP